MDITKITDIHTKTAYYDFVAHGMKLKRMHPSHAEILYNVKAEMVYETSDGHQGEVQKDWWLYKYVM